MLEDGLDALVYVVDDSVRCNDAECPCDGDPIPLARRVTPREIGAAVRRHRLWAASRESP